MFSPERLKALTFDVFGTTVDFRSSIIREGQELNRRKGLDVDWGHFCDVWRGLYQPSLARVATGELPWTKLEPLNRMALEEVLSQFGISSLDDDEKVELNRVWERLDPWPDTVAGLTRLRSRFLLAPLSNGGFGQLLRMGKRAGLPWDCILSVELAHAYKPDPRTYRMALELLEVEPDELMMVAAHVTDLRAAKQLGLRSAFVIRPLEFGAKTVAQTYELGEFDIVANDFIDLAKQLGV